MLKVEAVGLCASDVAQLHGHKHVPGEVSPVVPGHEIVGRVHALAPGAELGVTVGQRVAVDLVRRCGECEVCKSGSPYCSQMQLYGYTQGLDVRSGLHGGYGEYMEILPNTQLLPLTESVPAAQLSLFEPLANVINWFDRVDLLPGESVVIQGPGHMGLICAAYAKLLGAGTIIVTGRTQDRFRLDAALNLGATHVIDVDRQDLVSTVADLTDGRLVDLHEGNNRGLVLIKALNHIGEHRRVLIHNVVAKHDHKRLITDMLASNGNRMAQAEWLSLAHKVNVG